MTAEDLTQNSWPFHDGESSHKIVEDMVEWPDGSSGGHPTTFSSGLFLLDWETPAWQNSNQTMTLSMTAGGTHVTVSEIHSATLTDAVPIAGTHDRAEKTLPKCPVEETYSPSVCNSPPDYDEDPNLSKSPNDLSFKHFVACGEHVHSLEVVDRCGMGKLELRLDRAERRRRQNRSSQRRYRERKDAKVQAAQDEVTELKKTYTELQAHCTQLAQENLQLKAHCRDIETAFMMSAGTPFYTVSNSTTLCSVSTATVLEETMDAMNIGTSEEGFHGC